MEIVRTPEKEAEYIQVKAWAKRSGQVHQEISKTILKELQPFKSATEEAYRKYSEALEEQNKKQSELDMLHRVTVKECCADAQVEKEFWSPVRVGDVISLNKTRHVGNSYHNTQHYVQRVQVDRVHTHGTDSFFYNGTVVLKSDNKLGTQRVHSISLREVVMIEPASVVVTD